MRKKLTSIFLLLLISDLFAKPRAKAPPMPEADRVYTAFRASDIYGSTKLTNTVYKDISSLMNDLKKAKYLGVNLEIDKVRWRTGDDHFRQDWTVVLNKEAGMKIVVFEEVIAKGLKRRYCYLNYFYEANSDKNKGLKKRYYYQLPSKVEK